MSRAATDDSNQPDAIRLRGASEHNLAGLDLDLPLGRWIAVTGPSGSGKTSLVFDTLVREGERRFLGSLSARARHFYGKLGRAEVTSLENLPVTIAVGQRATTPSARSTVGTLTGTLDLLRLVFARAAKSPSGARLTRSHFSFNHPLGQCEACRGLGLQDRVDPAKIIADPKLSIRDGALVPTLKSGYTVYSQVTLEVMDHICRAHDFDVETPWSDLSQAQQEVILYGTRALKVPFGKHSIESRMKWEGITARPREEGYYLGLVPVIEETLKRNRNENILRFVSSGPCTECGGTRLGPVGREARFGEFSLPEVLALPASRLLAELDRAPAAAAWIGIKPSFEERVLRMQRLGLGHLSLDRTSTSLSGGEAQRVRLAAQLGAGLRGVLFALDEPTLGLHAESQAGMRAVLDELVEMGNSLIVVEHDPDMVRHADHVIALGPGAGTRGGRIIASELDGERSADPLGGPPQPKTNRRDGSGELTLCGARLHNLKDARLSLSLRAFNVIMGPSGAGKSSLLFGTLLPALLGGDGGPYDSLVSEGAQLERAAIQAVDARPIGKTPRSTPATWCGLFDLVRKRFAKLDEARELGLTASHFSFNGGRGRCETCKGLGVTRMGLHLFEDVELTCASCGGSRYAEQVLCVRLADKTIAEVLGLTFLEAHEFFEQDEPIAKLCAAMVELGLGYLTLGQSSNSLSRGEAQRIKLGTLLGSKRKQPTLVLLDEPDRGLAPDDVAALLKALDALVEAGHTLVAISHHRHVWAAADRLIEVRDGCTNHEPVVDWSASSKRRAPRDERASRSKPIQLRGVRTHNLRGVDVDFPHGQVSAVCGLSGSGKSSLVFDTLGAEAEARFAESLPFQVRRFLRRLPKPSLESSSGITPTLNLRQSRGVTGLRSSVATQSECGPLLRLLFSRVGVLGGEPCGLSASHFSREHSLGACPECAGRGTQQRCDPQRLVTDPELPLAGRGALSGTRPGRYFTESDGQHVATLLAALKAEGLSCADGLRETPWRELSDEVQRIALHGTGTTKYLVKWEFSSDVEGEGHHAFEATWDGLCALVEREAVSRARSKKAQEWAAPLGDVACDACSGSGLVEAARETRVLGSSFADIEQLPLSGVLAALQGDHEASAQASAERLLPELAERLEELIALGLGHLSLGRRSATLSTGELQRVRLASVLRSGLSGVTLVLDEPTAGLHERDVLALFRRLDRFRSTGNTVVLVTHRPSCMHAANHLIELGPGAGAQGGKLLGAGKPQVVLEGEGPTALALSAPPPASGSKFSAERISIRGARANNLDDIDVELPTSGFVCVTGVSGSGKSSLVFDVLGASVREGRPTECDSVEGASFAALHDARALPSSMTTLAALNIAGEVAALFEGDELPTRAFKPGDAAGRCTACNGSGRERVAMDFLADLQLPCEACGGQRFRPEVLEARWRGRNIAELLEAPNSELLHELTELAPEERTKSHAKLCRALEALSEVAAGHLPLGRPRGELSGGESGRVTLAANLLGSDSPALYLFDEPSTGLHEADLQRLIAVFRRLASRGDLVVCTEHRLTAIAAADWVIDLGPEGGPGGGQLIEAAAPSDLRHGHTAAALASAARAR